MKSLLAIFKFLNKFVDFDHKRERLTFKVKVNRMMKSFSSSLASQYAAFVVILFTAILFMTASSSLGLRPHQVSLQAEGGDIGDKDNSRTIDPYKESAKNQALGMEMYPTGSSLPDCSHACGPCFPCKRVIVSFKCSVEYCPIAYRCMCKGKYYHVPSN